MVDDDYGEDFIINYGIVSILPAEYDRVSKVSENEEDFTFDEADDEKPMCYYVMSSGIIEEQKALFKKLRSWMLYHLKPLFISEKVDGMLVNKVVINGGAAINLMPHALFKKMGKCGSELRPHNMVLSNYEGKTSSVIWWEN